MEQAKKKIAESSLQKASQAQQQPRQAAQQSRQAAQQPRQAAQQSQQTAQQEHRNYHRTQMQKERIVQLLKAQGCRITKQRLMLLDIILEEECSCCKEIYYKASAIDGSIGAATVYRMINILEDIGAISRKNMYKIACGCTEECCMRDACTIELEDNRVYHLSAGSWNGVIRAGLTACGYDAEGIKSVKVLPCECE